MTALSIDGELDRCLERTADGGDAGQCVDVYAREAADLRQKAAEVYAAVNAARAVEAREQQLLAEDAAETQRIDNERAAEEREAQRAAAAAEAAENPPEPPQRCRAPSHADCAPGGGFPGARVKRIPGEGCRAAGPGCRLARFRRW